MANEEVSNNLPAPRQLVPDDLLLRVLTKSKWLTDLHEAFMLRSDEAELSVFFGCTPTESVAISGLSSHGVASLVVRGVTDLQLTVTSHEQPHHAMIAGLPHKEEDADRAEWLASRLAEIATIVDRTRVKR